MSCKSGHLNLQNWRTCEATVDQALLGSRSQNTIVAWCQGTSNMQIKRWLRFGLLASAVWLVAGCLLASRNETWIAAWKLYCSLTADPTCAGTTVFLVAHWNAIAGIVLCPLILTWLIVCAIFALTQRIRRSGHGA
jgi:hypothetical protein